jgi:hypothetical protein
LCLTGERKALASLIYSRALGGIFCKLMFRKRSPHLAVPRARLGLSPRPCPSVWPPPPMGRALGAIGIRGSRSIVIPISASIVADMNAFRANAGVNLITVLPSVTLYARRGRMRPNVTNRGRSSQSLRMRAHEGSDTPSSYRQNWRPRLHITDQLESESDGYRSARVQTPRGASSPPI